MKCKEDAIKRGKSILFLLVKLVFVLLILLIAYHELLVPEAYWSGIYYPNGAKVGNAIYSSYFSTKEECIGWAINERGLRPEDKNVPLADLWECNKNCRLSPEYNTLLNSDQQYKQKLLDENSAPLYVCDDSGFDGGEWLNGSYKD